MNIALISSSTRIGRNSHRAALALQHKLQQSEATVTMVDLLERPLPPFSERYAFLDDSMKTENMHSIAADLQGADGIIFITPEYNGGIANTLKHLIDTFGKNEFGGKPIGVCTVSAGIMGGIRAAYQLQQGILSIQAYPMPQMLTVAEVTKQLGESGEILNETFQAKLDAYSANFLQFVARF